MKNTSFVDFKTALIIVRDLNINSVTEWRKWIKVNKDKKIPYNPDSFYKNSGWVNYKHFFGSNSLKRKKFITYNDARNLLKTYKLNNYKEFSKWVSKNMDKNIPSRPEQIYLKDWISWGDFLSSGKISNSKKIFKSYNDCVLFLKEIELSGHNSFIEWFSLIKPIDIPSNPHIIYKEKWVSWGEFLSTGNICNSKKEFIDYKMCRDIVIKNNIKTVNDFCKWIDRPENIPSKPNIIYKNNGWISWSDFLGRNIISHKKMGEKYLSYNDAKNYLKKFKTCMNIKELPFDFYLPEYNLCIEYDGEHHFHIVSKYGGVEYLEKVKRNDTIKNIWCLDNSIKLLRISYKEKGKIFDILSEKLLSLKIIS